jgi:hypothetical protein
MRLSGKSAIFMTRQHAKSINFACISCDGNWGFPWRAEASYNLIVRSLKMSKSGKLSIVLGTSLLFGTFCSAFAATKSNNLTISANVIATCSVRSPSLSLENTRAGLRDWAGNVAAGCSNGATYALAFDSGNAAAGNGAASVTLSY